MAKKTLTGTVVSDKMTNTVIVEVQRHTVHPLYKKRLKVTKKYSADCREVPVAIGDFVKIEQTVPMSKTKHFKVIEKIAEDVLLKLLEEKSEEKEEVNTEVVVEDKKETKPKTEAKKTRAKKGEKTK